MQGAWSHLEVQWELPAYRRFCELLDEFARVILFDGPARAINCAKEIGRLVQEHGLEVRAGVHTGEVERVGDDVAGIAVPIGARIAVLAGAGEVLVSGTVRDLVAGSSLEFSDSATYELGGVPGEWRVFAAH